MRVAFSDPEYIPLCLTSNIEGTPAMGQKTGEGSELVSIRYSIMVPRENGEQIGILGGL